MRPLGLWGLAAAAVALGVGPALAQRRNTEGQTNATLLLNRPSIQKELKLSDDQVQRVKAVLKKRQTIRDEVKDLDGDERAKKLEELGKRNDDLVAEILTPGQNRRLRQVFLQQQGIIAFSRPEVVKELGLTEEQQKKINDIEKEAVAHIMTLRQPGGGEEAMMKIGEVNKAIVAKAVNVLTDSQKARWKAMTGEPFKGELPLAMPGGPPGGRRRGPGG